MGSTRETESVKDLLGSNKVSIHLETASERTARLLREKEDAAHERARDKAAEDHERRKDFLLFVFSLLIVAGAALGAVVGLLISPANPPPWAAPLLTLIVGGLLTYLTGKFQATKGGQ